MAASLAASHPLCSRPKIFVQDIKTVQKGQVVYTENYPRNTCQSDICAEYGQRAEYELQSIKDHTQLVLRNGIVEGRGTRAQWPSDECYIDKSAIARKELERKIKEIWGSTGTSTTVNQFVSDFGVSRPFEHLPSELVLMMVKFWPIVDQRAMKCCCKFFAKLVQPDRVVLTVAATPGRRGLKFVIDARVENPAK
ncbi:hypothetical protein LTS18_003904 [Coniosporium uncinatum]|uniref:Uncharacterized protein n=1 Tax=Coniosporium uncinatum TaxID=93489 RepID=A0ACC3D6I9_9PEZI|nr:hypothetical protein LTS18_003904 [Coniosporium uncinatum]